ncbi:MAG TPA: homoserine dehydrogenase [Deinococcales bacterium]|nr:homoserine dehydrogenase [Deinococcales bacterium]
MKTIRLGLLGCGTVGAGFLTLLHRRRHLFEALGVHLELLPVLVRDPRRQREHEHPAVAFTSDPADLAGADALVEVMGGTDRPLELVLPALTAGKPVVTANKAMLAERWDHLRDHARAGRLYYEAAVMAGTPVVGPLSTTLRSSAPVALHALLSGTCGYIVGRMEGGADYHSALREAQALGYAEDPPTLDVGGWDAAHKLTVLARLTVDPQYQFGQVAVQGIEGLDGGLVRRAIAEGKRVKLVGSIVPEAGGWKAAVRPVLLPATHPLAQAGERACLLYRGDACGTVVLSGGGAGSLVTASAVLGDLLDLLSGRPGHLPAPAVAPLPASSVGEGFEAAA